jgi:hypothetical protein
MTKTRCCRVYVIELTDEAPGKRRTTNLPHIYVGHTCNTPERRLEIHRAGGKTSKRIVRLHAVRLRPDLYEKYEPQLTREAAELLEVRAAEELAGAGFTVHWGPGTYRGGAN